MKAPAETLACALISDNHSDDRVKVYCGTDVPLMMCGYHGTYHIDAVASAHHKMIVDSTHAVG